MLTFDGNGSRIVLEPDKIRIERKGLMGAIDHSTDNTIPMRSLQTVVYRKGSIFANGFIQFGTLGGQANMNTVFFYPGKNEEALRFKNAVEKQLDIYQKQQSQNAAPVQQVSPADEIKKLKGLLEEGIITQAEFDQKKKQLLGL